MPVPKELAVKKKKRCCPCRNSQWSKRYTYTAPPKRENQFAFHRGKTYTREIWQCGSCQHFVSVHELDFTALYEQDYVNSLYSQPDGILNTYQKILDLPPSRSDNIGRVQSLDQFAQKRFPSLFCPYPSILDVGSGLCVFLHKMKELHWRCTALDRDPRFVEQARKVVGVAAICGDFTESLALGEHDVISFNKVLEHVQNPIEMLSKAKKYLNPEGFVYLEVPDGEMAAREGFHREEFFVEHFHIFSFASLVQTALQSGFFPLRIERLQEPSSKYTFRAFLIPARDKRMGSKLKLSF